MMGTMTGTKKILIIDDEADIREVAAMSLRLVGGWQVVQAASGREGIEAAEREQPDAILLDVMMPDMDGPTTLRLLGQRASTAGIPVVFVTAKLQAQERRRFASLGAAGLVGKPFDPMTFPAILSRVLGWTQAPDAMFA